jgi:DNA mismatch repair protein MSH2
MNEMLEAACLLKSATQDSLVLMDELGRGTSTNEGFGLAYAISQYLAQDINCYTFFATHFHELTAIESEGRISNAKNLYVTVHAEEDKLTMLYKIKEGVIDRSYGIHVAEMLKFPQDIIDEANTIAAKLEDFQNSGHTITDMQ